MVINIILIIIGILTVLVGIPSAILAIKTLKKMNEEEKTEK